MSNVVCEVNAPWTMLHGWTRGPAEVDGAQTKTSIENNQCYTTLEIADILKISKSIKVLEKMKNVSFILQKNHTDFVANPIVTQIAPKSSSPS